MKKSLLVLLFFVFGYVACCAAESPSPQEISSCSNDSCHLLMIKQSQDYAQENWSISLPDSGWEYIFFPVVKLSLSVVNQELGYLIIFTKNETDLSYNDFVLGTMASVMSHGGNVHIIRHVTINGNNFIESQSIDEEEITWMWITVKDNHSYILTCNSGIDSQFEVCKSIAETLQIN